MEKLWRFSLYPGNLPFGKVPLLNNHKINTFIYVISIYRREGEVK
jgi:hypothetical protein